MANKEMSVKDYAKLRMISVQGVRKQIRNKRKLPGVKKVTDFGSFYTLTVNEEYIKLINV